MGKNRRKYTKEFKQESVEFLLRTGKPASKVAAELGISQEILSRWRREYETHQEKAFPGQGKPIEAELAQLRKELADVKMGILSILVDGQPFGIPTYAAESSTRTPSLNARPA